MRKVIVNIDANCYCYRTFFDADALDKKAKAFLTGDIFTFSLIFVVRALPVVCVGHTNRLLFCSQTLD